MKLNKEGNIFTFTFAAIMVLIVAISLAVISESLSPMQEKNKIDKKKINILSAIRVDSDRTNAEHLFDDYIKESKVINFKGQVIDGIDAFNIDVKKQKRNKNLSLEEKMFPIFIAKKEGEKYYVAPIVGSGLWGPIWGFIAFENDGNTIYGASFNHKGETPGLGAEIKETFFEETFIGKKILNNESYFISIEVMKGGAEENNLHQVDAITGGTITSDGVTNMLKEDLKIYNKYFETIR